MANSFLARLGKGVGSRLGSSFSSRYQAVGISWWGEKFYKHAPEGKLRSHTMFGHKFYFYSPKEFLHGLDELFLEEVYRQDLGPKPYIIDCGSNMGLSIIYLKQQYPDAEIVGFEPDEANFQLLSKNMESFGYQNVTLRKEAIWKENTVLRFSNDGTMSSKILDGGAPQSVEVKATRLKDLLSRPIDFLKMDIEGAEYTVMMDVAGHLSNVKNLFIEYHGTFAQQTELNTLLGMLTANGFHYYIKEASPVYEKPFLQQKHPSVPFDIQLNIFCFR